MYCKNCGYEIKEGQSFCPKCGLRIETGFQGQVQSQVPVQVARKKLKGKEKKSGRENIKSKQPKSINIIKIIAIVCCFAVVICGTVGAMFATDVFRATKKTDLDGITFFQTKSENIVSDSESGIEYVNNEILITADENAKQNDIENLVSKFGGKVVGKIDLTNDYQVQFDKTYDFSKLKDIVDELSKNDIITNASPNYAFDLNIDAIDGSAYIPNDKKWDSWDNIPGGNNWALEAIEAPAAWEYKNSLKPVNVGVIDNMFYTKHEDLKFEEMPLGNVKYAYEKNIDFDSHGTHVAGTIAAGFDNKKGISGVSVNQKLYGFSFKKFQEKQTEYTFKLAFTYLIGMKDCKVVNISAGTDIIDFNVDREIKNKSASTPAKDEIDLINGEISKFLKSLISSGKDFVICKSAGNLNSTNKKSVYKYFKKDSDDNTYPYEYISYSDFEEYCKNNKSRYKYPKYENRKEEIAERLEFGNVDANYGFLTGITDKEISDRLIVVGAVENVGEGKYQICDFSQCGKRVDILAPGDNVYSTVKEGNKSGYDYYTGTSMATPIVSGVASLIYSLKPDIDGPTVKNIIRTTGTGEYGKEKYKLLNAKNALNKANDTKTENTDKNNSKPGSTPENVYREYIKNSLGVIDYNAFPDNENNTGVFSAVIDDFDNDGSKEMVTFSYVRDSRSGVGNVELNLYNYSDGSVKLCDTSKNTINAEGTGAFFVNACGTYEDKLIKLQSDLYDYGGSVHKTVYISYKVNNKKLVKTNEFRLDEFWKDDRVEYNDCVKNIAFSDPDDFNDAVRAAKFDTKSHLHAGYSNSEFDPKTDDYRNNDLFKGNHIFTLFNNREFSVPGIYGFIYDNTGLAKALNIKLSRKVVDATPKTETKNETDNETANSSDNRSIDKAKDSLYDEWFNYYWENNIQSPCIYEFKNDNTLIEYYGSKDEPSSSWMLAREYKFTFNGDTLTLTYTDENTSKVYKINLKYVTLNDNIDWDKSLNLSDKLSKDEYFLYETDFDAEAARQSMSGGNAFYLKRAKRK